MDRKRFLDDEDYDKAIEAINLADSIDSAAKRSLVKLLILNRKVDQVSCNFKGQFDQLFMATGLFVVGHFFGWRVIRLCIAPSRWQFTNKLYGELKAVLPERGAYADKSLGLMIVDRLDNYWDVIRGVISIPATEKRELN